MPESPLPTWLTRQFDIPFRMKGAMGAAAAAVLATILGLLSPIVWLFFGLAVVILMLPLPGLHGSRKIDKFYYRGQQEEGLYLHDYWPKSSNLPNIVLHKGSTLALLTLPIVGFGADSLGLGNVLANSLGETGVEFLERVALFHSDRNDWSSSLYQSSFLVNLFIFYFIGFLISQYRIFFFSLVSRRDILQLILIVAIFSSLFALQTFFLWEETGSPDPTLFADESDGRSDYASFAITFSILNSYLGTSVLALIFVLFFCFPSFVLNRIRPGKHGGE